MLLWIFFNFQMTIEYMQHLAQVLDLKKKIQDKQEIKCQKLGFFYIFSETPLWMFLIFCMIIEDNTTQHLVQISGVKKNNLGISMGLDIQIIGFFHFFQKCYHNFILFFLHYDRGQHRATSGPGISCINKLLYYWAGPLLVYLVFKVLSRCSWKIAFKL